MTTFNKYFKVGTGLEFADGTTATSASQLVGPQGPQGDPGPQGNPGADALWNFTGAYNSGAAYAIGDVATYAGETWYRTNAHGGNVGDTPSEGSYWTKVAAKGDKGDTGDKGDKGDTGDTGATGAQGPKGDTGDTGPQGPQGDNGTAATITIGTVQTGAAGSNAVVANTGTANAAVLAFTIPRGDKGDTGDTGPQGPQGEKGDKGDTGDTGPAGANGTSVTIKGSYANYAALIADDPRGPHGSGYLTQDTGHLWVWDGSTYTDVGQIKGDKGDTGDTGPQGPQGDMGAQGPKGDTGTAATITVGTVETGIAGSSASVTNTGTSQAAILSFIIPRGDKGDTGDTGAQGEKGDKGDKGDTGDTGPQGIQGIQGVKGDTGDTGAQGPKGDTGTAILVTDQVLFTTSSVAFHDVTVGGYTLAATTSSLAVTVTGTPSGGDEYFNNVVLLLNAESTSDLSNRNKSFTLLDNANRSTSQYKFGTRSFSFDGNGDYLRVDNSSGDSDFNMGSGDWTVDFWVRFNQTNSGAFFFGVGVSGGVGFFFNKDQQQQVKVLDLQNINGFPAFEIGSTFVANTWQHVAFVRNSSGLKFYVDGTLIYNFNSSPYYIGASGHTYNFGSSDFTIGSYANQGYYMLDGYIDNFRVTKGVARYIGTFTPPTANDYGAVSSGTGPGSITVNTATVNAVKFSNGSVQTVAYVPGSSLTVDTASENTTYQSFQTTYSSQFNYFVSGISGGATVNLSSIDPTNYQAIKYFIKVTDDTGSGIQIHAQEMLVVKKGNDLYEVEYGVIYSDSSLGDFNNALSSGNIVLQYTPAGGITDVTINIVAQAI